jgi:hypothetical protein
MLAVLPCLAYTRIQVSFDHVKRTFALSRNSHGLDLLYPQIYWCTVSNLDGGHAYRCKIIPPVLNTSIRFSPKHANISTLHRPRPLTATSFSISSSSLALMSIEAVSSPDENFSASPDMYSALRWDRPAVRRVGRSFVITL